MCVVVPETVRLPGIRISPSGWPSMITEELFANWNTLADPSVPEAVVESLLTYRGIAFDVAWFWTIETTLPPR